MLSESETESKQQNQEKQGPLLFLICLQIDTQYRHIYPSLVMVQPRKNRPYITERLLMGHKESNQTNKQKIPNTKT